MTGVRSGCSDLWSVVFLEIHVWKDNSMPLHFIIPVKALQKKLDSNGTNSTGQELREHLKN